MLLSNKDALQAFSWLRDNVSLRLNAGALTEGQGGPGASASRMKSLAQAPC